MSQADRHHDLLHTIMKKKKIPSPNRELVEAYINTIVAYENLESGQPAPQQEAQTTDGSDQLTVFQVRGFRRDIMMTKTSRENQIASFEFCGALDLSIFQRRYCSTLASRSASVCCATIKMAGLRTQQSH
jgi:hypothetical protein